MDKRSMSDVAFSAEEVIRNCLPFAKRGGLKVGSKEHYRLVRRIIAQTDVVMKAFNRAYRAAWKRVKGNQIVKGLASNRDRSDPVVFYLVSSHQKPQPAHKDLQGKRLVDRFWRSALEGNDRLDEVARYVKGNGIRTVQWACGAPHYLLTRVNCHHVLIPLHTSDVLGGRVVARQGRQVGLKRPITDRQRAEVYGNLQDAILRAIEKEGL